MKLNVDDPLSTSYNPSPLNLPGTKDIGSTRTYRWSKEGASRGASTLKQAAASPPANAILLANGRPRWDLYPWLSTFRLRGAAPSLDIAGGTALGTDPSKLLAALNYGPATGLPSLQAFLAQHVQRMHAPPSRDWACSATCGTTSALDIVLRMFCERGDAVLAERRTYTGLLEAARPLGVRVLGVGMDREGVLAEELDAVLARWDEVRSGRRPGLLYVVPTGQNPTGATQSAERRRAVYEVAARHGVLIVEDDPYYFLQMGCYGLAEETPFPSGDGGLPGEELGDAERERRRAAYVASLPPSYLSLDIHGIVLRLDSASKILAPGLRFGWLTGPAEVVRVFKAHSEFSTEGPSGVTQLAMHSLLVEQWGQDGFLDWLGWLSAKYRERRDRLAEACQRWLPEGMCRWEVPTTGMFMWVSVDVKRYSTQKEKMGDVVDGKVDVEEMIASCAREKGVLVSKGSWFTAGGEDASTCWEVSFRLTFGAAAVEDLEEGVRRFGVALGQSCG